MSTAINPNSSIQLAHTVQDRASSGPESEGESKRESKFVALSVVLGLGLIVRAILWAAFAGQPVKIVDAQDYNRLAIGLVQTGSYITPAGDLSSQRPPLYPWIVAQIYRVFGVENYQAVRVVQALISLLTVLVIYRLGALLYSARVGVWAATFVCFYPTLLGFNNLLLSETLFTFLVCCGTWLTAEAVNRQSFGLLALVGILAGLGALTRSILMVFMVFLALYLLFAWRGALWRRLVAGAVPLLLFAATIAPWAYRNYKVQKVFAPIDVMGGRNAMMGNYEYTPLERSWATISDVTGEKAWHLVLRRKHPELKGATQGQLDKAAMKYGIEFVKAHPVLTAKRTLVRFFNFWQLERTLVAGAAQGLWGQVSKLALLGLAAAICGCYAFGLFSGILGMFLARPADRRQFWLLLLTIAVPCAIHTAIFAHSRYHLPTMPLVLLFSSACCANWKSIWERRTEWSFRIAVLCCVLFAMAWLRELVFVDLAHAHEMIP